ncbi:response regulator, partial [Archangium sp.]|uniref:response regulator n=1 Tax=Archangium sp. TaxID=1872627 RepID=UPI002EDBA025
MERRVLIVESQNDFALSMATVLKSAGYQTAMAATAADAQREMEKRRPDLVVVRAELPDQSGFTLCGQIKKGKWGQNLKVLLLSSDTGVEGLNQHRQTPGAADGYLLIPFEMGELAVMSLNIIPPGEEEPQASASGEGPPAMPPPLRAAPAGGPPKLPKRERRSAITEEDRTFLERSFQSIADRKAELLAESRQLKRPPPRRDLMGTPEGKIQLLRDELKGRESQIARISEIWTVRERELLSVEDRLH